MSLVAVMDLHGEVLGFGGGEFTLLVQQIKDSVGLRLDKL